MGNVLIWLLSRSLFPFFRGLLALLLLIFLQALALSLEQRQLMPQMPQLRSRYALHLCLFKTNLDRFVAILGHSLNLCHNTWASLDHSNRDYGSIGTEYLSHADFS